MSKENKPLCPNCGVHPNPGCLCTGGFKQDEDKPDISLIPTEFMEEIAKAFQYGAKKYSRHNYLTGMEWSRMYSATMRHMYKFWRGEEIDPETGIHHLGHAGAGLGMLFMHISHKLGTDNRWKGSSNAAEKPITLQPKEKWSPK